MFSDKNLVQKMSFGIDEFKELLDEMKKELLKDLSSLITEIKNRTNLLNEKIIKNEREMRRKNLIIKGFVETELNESDLEKRILEFINSKLQVKIDDRDIDVIFGVGKKQINCEKNKKHCY